MVHAGRGGETIRAIRREGRADTILIVCQAGTVTATELGEGDAGLARERFFTRAYFRRTGAEDSIGAIRRDGLLDYLGVNFCLSFRKGARCQDAVSQVRLDQVADF